MKVSDLQEQQTMISQEALKLREQCNNYIKEIEHLNGASELAVYHVVERERNKWEEWETRWLRESDYHNSRPDKVIQSRSISECTGIPTSVSTTVVNSDSGTLIALASLPLSPIMVPTCTTLPSVSMSTAGTLNRINMWVTSCDMFSSVGARPTLGADTQAFPLPSFVPPMEMRPNATMMEAGTWGASRSQLDSGRHWIELLAVRTTVSSNPSSLCLTDVSCTFTVSVVPSTTSLSVLATSFFPSCVSTIGVSPSVSSYTTQSGDHVFGSS